MIKIIIYMVVLLATITAALAIAFTPKGDVDLQNRYGIVNGNVTYMPAECLLTNSWISYFNFANSTCRTINVTALIGTTFPSLAGTGKALLCVDANGLIYRGNATACP